MSSEKVSGSNLVEGRKAGERLPYHFFKKQFFKVK